MYQQRAFIIPALVFFRTFCADRSI